MSGSSRFVPKGCAAVATNLSGMHESMAAEFEQLRDDYLASAERADAMVNAIAYMSVRIALLRATQALTRGVPTEPAVA